MSNIAVLADLQGSSRRAAAPTATTRSGWWAGIGAVWANLVARCRPSLHRLAAATPRVSLFRKGAAGWFRDACMEQMVARGWRHPWKAAICIESRIRQVGHYGGSTTLSRVHDVRPKAYRTIWQVTVVRLRDGRRFKTVLRAEPPPLATGSWDRWGDPVRHLMEWLDGALPA